SHTTLYHFNRHIPNHATPDRRFLRCHTAVSVVSLKRPSQDALHSLQAHIFQTCAVALVGQLPKGRSVRPNKFLCKRSLSNAPRNQCSDSGPSKNTHFRSRPS